MEDLFSSEESDDEKASQSGSGAASPQSDDEGERSGQSEVEARSDRESEGDAGGNSEHSEQSEHEVSISEDEERNFSEGEHSVHSDIERLQSDIGSERQQSDAGSDRPHSDIGSDRPHSDVGSDRPHSDVGSERQQSDDEGDFERSEGGESDNEEQREHIEQSEKDESDAEEERSESEYHQSEAEASEHHEQSEAEHSEEEHSEGEGKRLSDDEGHEQSEGEAAYHSEEMHSDAENEHPNRSPHSPSPEKTSDIEYQHSDQENKSGYSEEEEDTAPSKKRRKVLSSEEEQSDKGSDEEQEDVAEEKIHSDNEVMKSSDAEQSPRESEDEEHNMNNRRIKHFKSPEDNMDRDGSGSEDDVKPKRKRRYVEDDDESAKDSGDEPEVSRKRLITEDFDDGSVVGSEDEIKPRKRRSPIEENESMDGSGDEIKQNKKRSHTEDDEDGSLRGLDSEDEVKEQRKGASVHDDSANENSVGDSPKGATAHDVFGEDLGDISSEDEQKTKDDDQEDQGREVVENGDIERQSPVPVVGDEEQEQEEPIPETRIEVEIPRITTNLGKEIHFIKLPNFLSVDTRPYDPQWYEDEVDEDEVLDEEGRARLKLKVENTIRWKYEYDELGNPVKASNARIVKWSDGSLSLHLGSEIFDVYRQTVVQGEHNHLFIRQGTGLQGQAVFRTKLTFRPHSTDSFTHRKMTLSLADRNQKTQKIRVLPNVGQDPEAHRSEMIKKEEDRLKASIRRESKQRRMKEKSHSRGLSASYLEPDRYEDEDDGAISLSAIKNRYKKGAALRAKAKRERPSIYSSDDGSEEDQKAKRLEQAKSLDDGEEDEDDSDLDYFDKKKAAFEGKKKTATIEESDEDS